MTDIVERLRLFVPHCEDPNDYLEDELLFLKAADEIEKLRDALQEIANIKISPEDGVNKYIVFKARSTARAAIGAKIDE